MIGESVSTAERPVVICGPLKNATRFDAFASLADALGAPIIQMESPRGLKDLSLGAIPEALRRADLIVNSGKHVDFTLGFGKTGPFAESANWIKVDPYAQERDLAYRNLAAVFLSLSVAGRPARRCLATGGPRERWCGSCGMAGGCRRSSGRTELPGNRKVSGSPRIICEGRFRI